MYSIFYFILFFFVFKNNIEAQIHLTPVNGGDCVADRIYAKRTAYVDKLMKRYCSENNRDKNKIEQCIKNSMADNTFSFFTDRCSEMKFYIGLNGREVPLKKISKTISELHYFIGSYAGEGYKVVIHNPRLVGKSYDPPGSRKEADVIGATYNVDVTVTKGKLKETINNVVLSSGF